MFYEVMKTRARELAHAAQGSPLPLDGLIIRKLHRLADNTVGNPLCSRSLMNYNSRVPLLSALGFRGKCDFARDENDESN